MRVQKENVSKIARNSHGEYCESYYCRNIALSRFVLVLGNSNKHGIYSSMAERRIVAAKMSVQFTLVTPNIAKQVCAEQR